MRGTVIAPWILAALVFTGCAKASDPVKPNTETGRIVVEKTLPTVGDPLDLAISDEAIYVAENQGGFSIFNAQTGSLINRYNEYNGIGVRAKKVSLIPEQNRVVVINSIDSDQILMFDTENINGLSFAYTIGQTDKLTQIKLRNTTHEYTSYLWQAAYSASQAEGFLIQRQNQIQYRYLTKGTTDVSGDQCRELFTRNTDFIIRDIERDDQYLYLAAEERGLVSMKLDFTAASGSDLYEAGEADTPGDAYDLELVDSYAYIADVQGGLQVVDLTDRNHPALIPDAGYKTSSFARSVRSDGNNNLLVGTYGDGVYLFDISDRTHPVYKEHLTKSAIGYVNEISFYDGRFYIASRDKGVVVVRIDN